MSILVSRMGILQGVSAAPITEDIILVMGASNATGYEEAGTYNLSPDAGDTTRPNLYQIGFDGSDVPQTATLADDPMDFLTSAFDSNLSLSPATQMGRVLADANTEKDFILIPTAEPSTGLLTGIHWDYPLGGNYLSSVDGVDEAIVQFSTAVLTDLLWCSLANVVSDNYSVAAYETNFDDLITNLRTYNSDARVVIWSTPQIWAYGYLQDAAIDVRHREVLESQRQWPLDNDYGIYVAGPLRSLNNTDFLQTAADRTLEPVSDNHYSVEANREIGNVLGDMRPLVDGLTTAVPDAVTVTDAGNGYAQWTVPTTGAHKYILEYRDSGSGDPWVAVDRFPYWGGQVPGETYIANVPTTSAAAQDVRVTAVSRFGNSTVSSEATIAAIQRSYGWRVRFTATNGNAFLVIEQLGLRDISGGNDIVLECERFNGLVNNANNRAFRAFDSRYRPDTSTPTFTGASGEAPNGNVWIGVYFEEPRAIGEWLIRNRGDGSANSGPQSPNAMQLQRAAPTDTSAQCRFGGSATWTSVKSVTGETGWTSGETRTYTV